MIKIVLAGTVLALVLAGTALAGTEPNGVKYRLRVPLAVAISASKGIRPQKCGFGISHKVFGCRVRGGWALLTRPTSCRYNIYAVRGQYWGTGQIVRKHTLNLCRPA